MTDQEIARGVITVSKSGGFSFKFSAPETAHDIAEISIEFCVKNNPHYRHKITVIQVKYPEQVVIQLTFIALYPTLQNTGTAQPWALFCQF